MTSSEGAASPKKTPLYKNPFFLAFLAGALGLLAIRPLQSAMRSAPPPMVSPGAWSLIDHEGRPFGSKELEGKVWIADFFFTRCPSICPELTRKMIDVESRFEGEDGVRFVSFSVDPEHDKPEVLRDYRQKFRIDDPRWTFVTGSEAEVHRVLVEQMKLHMGEKKPLDPKSELFDISHVSRFALFDQNGDLRALASTDGHGLARLVDAAKLLLEEGPDP